MPCRSVIPCFSLLLLFVEEAENERMHLMVVLQLKQPGKLFRFGVVVSQGVYVNVFFLLYLISPRYCHRFVGYLEEEAVKTYTRLLKDIDDGLIPEWQNKPASEIAVGYWKLPVIQLHTHEECPYRF